MTFRLGLRLSLRSGREALVRLVLTATAVAIGVTILLGLFADFHAFQVTSKRPSWESTQPAPTGGAVSNQELWNYSESIYRGRFIEQLDVAALGPQAPVLPGIRKLPGPGEYYASPALATLLRNTPRAELGDRYPGVQVGTIGNKALTGPSELAIIVGYAPTKLAALPDTIRVDRINTAPRSQGTTNLYRLAFGIGAIGLTFPLLVLINTATRLAAARREERYAALRLVGATPRQVNVIASIDAVVGALLGTVLGTGLFLLLRPVLAHIALSGARFFPQTVTPTILGYAIMLMGVPVAAAVASLVSLRPVQISPLGVSRRVTPAAPRPWRLVPLVVGVPLFIYPLVQNPGNPRTGPIFLGLVLIMAGLVSAGSWLTMQAARLLARLARGPSSLLAARRLADNPKAAFRAVSGLVLAVFVGTAIAGIVPAITSGQSTRAGTALSNVLRVPYFAAGGADALGLAPETGAALLANLQSFPGATVLPFYDSPASAPGKPDPGGQPGPGAGQRPPPGGAGAQGFGSVISCERLARLPVLGTCPPGAKTVGVNVDLLFNDNPLQIYKNLPLATPSNPSSPDSVSGQRLQALVIRFDNPAILERIRTLLTTFGANVTTGGAGLTAWQMGELEPITFGEVAQLRKNTLTNVERVILAALCLTLLVAACSLAINVGGSLVERKRPFTLLRLSGTAPSALRNVVLLESTVPLLVASLVAALAGFGVGIPIVQALLPAAAHAAHPGPIYYLTMVGGLIVSLGVISLTLPLLARITEPNKAQFE